MNLLNQDINDFELFRTNFDIYMCLTQYDKQILLATILKFSSCNNIETYKYILKYIPDSKNYIDYVLDNVTDINCIQYLITYYLQDPDNWNNFHRHVYSLERLNIILKDNINLYYIFKYNIKNSNSNIRIKNIFKQYEKNKADLYLKMYNKNKLLYPYRDYINKLENNIISYGSDIVTYTNKISSYENDIVNYENCNIIMKNILNSKLYYIETLEKDIKHLNEDLIIERNNNKSITNNFYTTNKTCIIFMSITYIISTALYILF